MLTLTLKAPASLPLELADIVPHALTECPFSEIERLEVPYGNAKLPLGELFEVKGDADDEQIIFVGDLNTAVGIGAAMKSGSIRIDGNGGHDVGSGMWAGEIEVADGVGDNLGAEMRGGTIRVRGSAGDNVGGPRAGSVRGMTGGAVLIEKDAGDFAGRRMRRGLIAVGGRAQDHLGHAMLAGSIVVTGNCGVHPGAEMTRGTICIAAPDHVELLPTFRYAWTAHMPVLGMIGRQLHSLGFENDIWNANRRWRQFNGDFLCSGRGEVFLAEN